jgi:hypothetical protein
MTSWELEWTMPSQHSVTQPGWNAVYSQSGANVVATSTANNGNLMIGSTVDFGFNAAMPPGSVPMGPSQFTMDGVVCSMG